MPDKSFETTQADIDNASLGVHFQAEYFLGDIANHSKVRAFLEQQIDVLAHKEAELRWLRDLHHPENN